MAKSKKREKARADKRARKRARFEAAKKTGPKGESKYAKKHRGGGNTGPHGMWQIVEVG